MNWVFNNLFENFNSHSNYMLVRVGGLMLIDFPCNNDSALEQTNPL